MKRFLTLVFIISLGPLIGGIYGILHDQLTYTISPEYYTKFKFIQFGLVEEGSDIVFANPRKQVAIVGFLATWWMGPPIALVLGLLGLGHKDEKQMFWVTLKAMGLTMLIAFTTGLIGLAYGKYNLAESGVDWWLPENLVDKASFIAVGSMHNFSYLGGLFGLVAGSIYSARFRLSRRKVNTSTENSSGANKS